MKRFSAVVAFVLAFLSLDSSALTLQALPGTTPQETCFSCVFPNEIGVIARDAAGQPAAGIPVTFTTQSNTLGIVRYDEFCCVAWSFITVPTGADGIAHATAITIYHGSASGTVVASSPGAANAVFSLSSNAVRATTVEIVSGWNQVAQTGTPFAAPWQARALDANGQPVPRTMLTFYVGDYGNGESSATFNGADRWAFAVAGADGVATSPIARADGIGSGTGYVQAATKAVLDGTVVPYTREPFHVVSQPLNSVTLQPLPGTTPQETCFSCVFPNEIGVIARNSSGQPVAGVPVTFTSQSNTLGMVRYDEFCCVAWDFITVPTGADGIARATAITVWHPSSSGIVTASTPGAADALFNLSSSAVGATRVEIVGGQNQYAQTGTTFSAPWKARAVDANGQPVPRTMITFYVGTYEGTESTATFNGADRWAFAVADANGVATSPIARADAVGTGTGYVDAATKAVRENEVVPFAREDFHVLSYPITARSQSLVSAPPDSLQLYTTANKPHVVLVRDAAGHAAANMPVTFTAEACLSVYGMEDGTVFTDTAGIARSPLVVGEAVGTCNLRIVTAGVAGSIVVPIYVFDPATVVMTPRSDWVTARTRRDYRVTVDFTSNGRGVQPFSLDSIEDVRHLPGPPAGFTGTPAVTFQGNSALIDLRANNVPGLYDVEVVYTGGTKARVHILQTP